MRSLYLVMMGFALAVLVHAIWVGLSPKTMEYCISKTKKALKFDEYYADPSKSKGMREGDEFAIRIFCMQANNDPELAVKKIKNFKLSH